jgi:AcrR family transcriptional regulator
MVGDRRAEIIEAGRTSFAAAPFQHVSMRDIYAKAGIGNGSFYHVFPNKLALAAELYQAACQRRDQLVRAALEDCPENPSRAIQAAVGALARFLGSGETDACLLRRLGDAVSAHPMFVADRDGLAGLVAVLTPWARPLLALAQMAPVAPSVVAALLWGAARALADHPHLSGRATTDEAVAELGERIAQALQPPAAKAPDRQTKKSRRSSPTPGEPDLLDSRAGDTA